MKPKTNHDNIRELMEAQKAENLAKLEATRASGTAKPKAPSTTLFPIKKPF